MTQYRTWELPPEATEQEQAQMKGYIDTLVVIKNGMRLLQYQIKTRGKHVRIRAKILAKEEVRKNQLHAKILAKKERRRNQLRMKRVKIQRSQLRKKEASKHTSRKKLKK